VSRYHIGVPLVIPGSTANELVQKGSNFRNDVPVGSEVFPFSTHCTTFGDVMTAILKEISISEARDKVPANDVRIMSRPFEVEQETTNVGLRFAQSRQGANDRTMDRGFVGPTMCRCAGCRSPVNCESSSCLEF
jgi:hypothetical protein